MTRPAWIALGLLTAALAGCEAGLPGRSRSLGPVTYEQAFAASREVLVQYYSIESADPATGELISRPAPATAPNERILGGSPARERATIRLRKEGGEVVAYVAVAVQRQGGSILRTFRPGSDNYSSVPDQTPAQRDAATTVEQNEAWRTHDYNHVVERKILDDIYRSIHPGQGKP